MMKIFRKIRQRLLSENRTRKYLLYAAGEIILVVLGILIALQVNTIKNNQQRNALEKKILREISTNLAGDLVDVQDELESFKVVMQVDSALISHFKSKRPFNDTIGANLQIFQASPHLSPARSAYNLLESKGIDLISNDALRIQISDMYERSYPYYFTYAEERFRIIETLIQPYLAKHFYIESYPEWPRQKRVPIDYQALLGDPTMIVLLQTSSYQASVMLRKSRDLKKDIESLQKNISTFLHE